MKTCLSLLALAAFLPITSAGAAETADKAYMRLAEEAIAASLAWRPLDATNIGLHEYDAKLPSYGKSAITSGTARLQACMAGLQKLAPSSLSPRSRYDRLIILAGVQRDLFWRLDARRYFRDPMAYIPDLAVYVQQEFASPAERLKSVIAIQNALPDVYAAARENLDQTLPGPAVTEAIRNARGAAEFFERDLVEAFRGAGDESLQTAFRASTQVAARELRSYAAFLEKQRLPNADQDYALGRDRYRKMLSGELVSLTPEALLTLGMRELKREQDRFAAAARAIDPHHKPVDVFAAIQREHPTSASLVGDTAKNLEGIRQFLIDHDIVTVPSKVRAVVQETPPYLRQAFAMMCSPGPLEKNSSQAYYYVTPVDSSWTDAQKEQWLTSFNYYTTDVVSIHEAYPGHYVHGLHLRASGVSRPEAVFSSYAFTEGWAHYTEQMMLEQGFGDGCDSVRAAKYRLAQSDEALLRLCRLCVSIRMHCQVMTVDEAARFFEDNCYYEAKPARTEAIRGTYDPEYLYYTLGKLQFLKLREDYRKQEGPAFSLRKFHDAALSHGTPPLRLLRQQLLHDPAIWDQVL
jgi:uncharacterized protein (DUF885 family)